MEQNAYLKTHTSANPLPGMPVLVHRQIHPGQNGWHNPEKRRSLTLVGHRKNGYGSTPRYDLVVDSVFCYSGIAFQTGLFYGLRENTSLVTGRPITQKNVSFVMLHGTGANIDSSTSPPLFIIASPTHATNQST